MPIPRGVFNLFYFLRSLCSARIFHPGVTEQTWQYLWPAMYRENARKYSLMSAFSTLRASVGSVKPKESVRLSSKRYKAAVSCCKYDVHFTFLQQQ